jgi:hypothetical protein
MMLATAGTLTQLPYTTYNNLDGAVHIYNCNTLKNVDNFFMRECSKNMTNEEIALTYDFINYEEGKFNRDDPTTLDALTTLDAMFTMMVNTPCTCSEATTVVLSGC